MHNASSNSLLYSLAESLVDCISWLIFHKKAQISDESYPNSTNDNHLIYDFSNLCLFPTLLSIVLWIKY